MQLFISGDEFIARHAVNGWTERHLENGVVPTLGSKNSRKREFWFVLKWGSA
jgi:hypothetical protein